MAAGALLALVALLAGQDGGREPLRLNGRTAVPRGNADWIDPVEDYPPAAARAMEGGTVVARVFVNGAGRVAGCLIRQSPGFGSLERTTCRALRSRAVFVPFSGGGLAVFDYRIVWDLSRAPPVRRAVPSTPMN